MSLAKAETVPEPAFSLSRAVSNVRLGRNDHANTTVEQASPKACLDSPARLKAPAGGPSATLNAKTFSENSQIPEIPENVNPYSLTATNDRPLDRLSKPATKGKALLTPSSARLPPPRVLDADASIAIVGVGYVGVSLLQEFVKPFPQTIGYDISATRIEQVRHILKGPSGDPHHDTILTTDARQLSRASYFLIAVPTLLHFETSTESASEDSRPPKRSRTPTVDLDYVKAAVTTVLQHCRRGSVIVLESSVSVGTTRTLLEPHQHLVHAGMSPERVDPGRLKPVAAAVPKLVSGLTPTAIAAITALYQQCYDHVFPVSSPEVAEMTKLYENCFRMVNIAYANEIADVCHGLGIDYQEVQDAARTKPYGFMPFSAGLGVGGHCIPVNPYYLFSNCKKGALPVLEHATKNMKQRPRQKAKGFYRRATTEMAKRDGLPAAEVTVKRWPRILVVGLGFKPGEAVLSYSPGLDFARSLKSMGCARLSFYDPLVEQNSLRDDALWLVKTSDAQWHANDMNSKFDGIAVCMKQIGVDWSVLQKRRSSQSAYVRWFV